MRAAMIAGALALLAGCAGASAQSQRSFQVGAFDRISLAGSPDVVVAVGGQPSVRAEGDADTIERLEIAVVDGELRIGMRPGSGSWGGHRGVTVHVTVPALQAASIQGSGDMRVDRVEGARFAGRIAGSGDLDVTALRVGEASFSVRGSGGIRAAGAAPRATLNVAGSGGLVAGRLRGRRRRHLAGGIGRHRSARDANGGDPAQRLGRRRYCRPGALHHRQDRLGRRPLRRVMLVDE